MEFLLILLTLAMTCNEGTMKTGSGVECERVIKKSPVIPFGIPSKWGMIRTGGMGCDWGMRGKLIDGECVRIYLVIKK